ncbi:LPD38 domain-containing protein [Paraburkholderia dinghuensis]|uniref:L,D-TPase catalytic domain-containing protein n=1 Tax=Paraburkholderia dinghuensis TaxID=2305225 RepID=A0A3N6MS57_9BURK|nr:LPD38 domain-containing protein [Paraburkholderia dinghuensis]RQH06618.1 hypothetical protein D1Y85_12155 [Paraburkholderia dinghuensis]
MGVISDLMAGANGTPSGPRTYTQLTSDPGFLGASYEERRRQYAEWLKNDAPQLLQATPSLSDKQKHQFLSEVNQRFTQDVPRPASGGVFGNDLFNRATIGLNEGIASLADAVHPGSDYSKAIRDENARIRASMSPASQDEDLAMQERLAKAGGDLERAKVYGQEFLRHPLDTMAGFGGSAIPALLGGAVAAPVGIAAGAAQAFGGSRGAQYELAQTVPLEQLRQNPQAAAMLDAGIPEEQVRDQLGRQIGPGNVVAGLGGAVSGSFLGRFAGGELGEGIAQALESGWRAPVAGALEQGLAGGVMQLGTNLAEQQVQPDVSAGQDILSAAAQGALPGAVLGGMHALRGEKAAAPAPEPASETAPEVAPTTTEAPPPAPPTTGADLAHQADLEDLTAMYQGTAEQPVRPPMTQEEAYARMSQAPEPPPAQPAWIDPDEFGTHMDALDAQRQASRDDYENWWSQRLAQLDAQPWRQDLRPDESATADYQQWWHDGMMNQDSAQQVAARASREAAEAEDTRNALAQASTDEQYQAIAQRLDNARQESLRGVVDRVADRAVTQALADPSSGQSASDRFNRLLETEMANYPYSRAQMTPELMEQGQRLAAGRLDHAQGLLQDTADYLRAIPDMSAQETAAWINDAIPERRAPSPTALTPRMPRVPGPNRAERGQAANRAFAFDPTSPAYSRASPTERAQAARRTFAFGEPRERTEPAETIRPAEAAEGIETAPGAETTPRAPPAGQQQAVTHAVEARAETGAGGGRARGKWPARAEGIEPAAHAAGVAAGGESGVAAARPARVQYRPADTGYARTPAPAAEHPDLRRTARAREPDTGPGAADLAARRAREGAGGGGATDTGAAGAAGGEPARRAGRAAAGQRDLTGENDHAIQEQGATREMLRGERPEVELHEVGEGNTGRREGAAGEAQVLPASGGEKGTFTRHEALGRIMSELSSIGNTHTRNRERTYFREQLENVADPQTGHVDSADVERFVAEAREHLDDRRLRVAQNRRIAPGRDLSADEKRVTDEQAGAVNERLYARDFPFEDRAYLQDVASDHGVASPAKFALLAKEHEANGDALWNNLDARAKSLVNEVTRSNVSPEFDLSHDEAAIDDKSAAPVVENVNRLTPDERSTLQDAATAHGIRSPARFAMIANLNREFPGSIWHNLSARIKSLVDKVTKGIGIVAAAVALNHALPVHDARAASGHGDVTISARAHTAGLEGRSDIVSQWVQRSGDNNGGGYVIADKGRGELYVMSPRGEVQETIPALFGAKAGDEAVPGETPAGAFRLDWSKAPDTKAYGDSIQSFSSTDRGTFAIHRVLTGRPENREARLASGNAAQRRITNGCINIPADTYNRLFDRRFSGKLYVVPETGEVPGRHFPGMPDQPAAASTGMGGTTRLPRRRRGAAEPAAEDAREATADVNRAARESARAPEPAASQAPQPSRLASRAAKLASMLSRDENPIPRTHEEAMRMLRGEPVRDAKPPDNDTLSYKLWRNLRESLNFSDTPFLSWARQNLKRDGGEYDSIPAYREWRLMKGRARAEYHDLLHDQGSRLMDLTSEIAGRHADSGRDPAQIAREISYYPTWSHIAGSATDVARAGLHDALQNAQGKIDEVVKRGEVATPDMMRTRDAARDALSEFDHAQAHGGLTESGEQSRLLPGGITRAQAREGMAALEARYGKADLQRLAAEHVKVHGELRRAGIDAGVYDKSLEDSALNKDYVPLTGDPGIDTTGERDVFGASAMNHDIIRSREGRASLADDALTAFHARASELSRAIAKQPFVDALAKSIEEEKPAGAHIVPDSQSVGRPGMATSVIRYRDENGNRRKIYWDDEHVGEALRAGMDDTHSAVLQKLGAGTRGYFQLLTRFTPMFAPLMRARDVLERSLNAVSRNILTVDGNAINRTRFLSDVARSQVSPQMNGAILNMLRAGPGKFADMSKFGQYLKELHEGGALTTYTSEYAASRDSIMREAARAKDVFKAESFREGAFTARDAALNYVNKYNEFFDTGSALSIYSALRDQSVPKQEALFRTLDLFDLNQHGTRTGWARAFFPFTNSTLKGGANFVRSLSTRRGQAVFATAFVGAMMMYAMARGTGNDDPDMGNEIDNLPMSTVANGIPVKVGDHFISVPVGYGIPKVAWELAVLASRGAAGKADMSDVVFGAANSVLKETTPLALPEGSSGNLLKDTFLSATPGLLRPAAQVAMNTSTFGSPITRDLSPDQYRSMQGQMNTEESYKRLANNVREVTGLDLAPEEWKTLVNGYMIGPLTGLASLFREPGAKGRPGSTRDELGLADAFGLSRVLKSDPGELQSVFYDTLNRAQAQQRAAKAGDADANPVRDDATTRATNALRTLSKEANQAYRDANGDTDVIRPQLEAIQAQREAIMRDYLREVQ